MTSFALLSCCPHPPRQSEYGDLYKVTLGYSNDKVTEVKVKYFDTIPVCTSVCVLKTGFLFAASEAGNHALYLFIVSVNPGLFPGPHGCVSLLPYAFSLPSPLT